MCECEMCTWAKTSEYLCAKFEIKCFLNEVGFPSYHNFLAFRKPLLFKFYNSISKRNLYKNIY